MSLISSDGSILILAKDCVTDLKVNNPNRFSLSTAPSSSLLFSGTGTTTPLTGSVRISGQSGNVIILRPDGLYVTFPSYTETLLTAIDSPTINLTTTGLSSHTLKADVKVSAAAGNALIVKPDGLYTTAPTGGTYTDAQARNAISALTPLQYNNTTGVLSILKATALQAGYLSALDWVTFNSKEPAITGGNTSQYWRGDKTWQTLNTSVVPELGNLYFTTVRARNALSALAPISYNNITGVISMVPAGGGQDGYLSSIDWNTFNSKIGDGLSLASVNAQSVYKDKVSGVLRFRGIRGDGATITASLIGDDIVLTGSGSVPVVNAGADKSVVLPTTSVAMTGGASTSQGTMVSTTWLFISGPSGWSISDASSPTTLVTGLSAGTFVFRLLGINSFGLSNTDDVAIVVSGSVVVLDTIYVGAKATGSTPTEAEILASISSTQNGALNVNADWTSFNSVPQFTFFAIPDGGAAYEKNKWYVDPLNNGNIGSPSDAFGALSVVTVNGNAYSVGISNYATQWTAVVSLQKV